MNKIIIILAILASVSFAVANFSCGDTISSPDYYTLNESCDTYGNLASIESNDVIIDCQGNDG